MDRVIEYTCDTIKKIRKVHLVRSIGAIDVNMLLKKNSTCFCYFGVDSEFSSCENLP